MWANGHPRYVHAGAGMLAVAAAVGTDDFPRCRHGRWRGDPYLAVMEILILVMAPILVLLAVVMPVRPQAPRPTA